MLFSNKLMLLFAKIALQDQIDELYEEAKGTKA
jgi:hypothetical protein